MTLPRRFKAPSAKRAVVAVIASEADLARAADLRRPPDFFELRLDALGPALRTNDPRLARLRAPLIITARDPAEGGLADLPLRTRRDLLQHFLPLAACVDLELRSAPRLRAVSDAARARQVRRIISVHVFDRTPTENEMRGWADAARELEADMFKLAVRTDAPAAVDTLLRFFDAEQHRLPISAMGIGKLGRRARIELARRGSALIYAHLGKANAEGQLSLAEVRRLMRTEVAPSPQSA